MFTDDLDSMDPLTLLGRIVVDKGDWIVFHIRMLKHLPDDHLTGVSRPEYQNRFCRINQP